MSFEYFYGGQSEAFSFYRIPRQLVTGAEFRSLSTDAKLLYGMMLLYGNKRYVLCAVITVLFTVAVWLLFTKVFLIFLPAGKLF